VRDLAGNAFAGLSGASAYNFTTAPAPDTTAPTVSFTDDAPGTASASVTYTLSFSEAVTGLGTDDFTVTNGTVSSVAGSGASYSVVVAPSANTEGTLGLSLKAGAVVDGAANPNALSAAPAQPIDTRAPVAQSLNPADNATGVAIDANLVLSFSEAIQRGTGSVVLKTAAGAIVASYDAATSANLSISGSTLTLNPSASLAHAAGYYLEIGAQAVRDLAGNAFAGLSGASAYNFTTAPAPDTTAPTVLSFNPLDEATGVAVGANIVVTFSEAIQRGTGSIVLKTSGGAVIATYNAADSANLVISGNTLTIDPSTDLATGIGYQLEFAAGNLQDLAGNPYAGTASYNFTTIGVIGGLIGGNGDDQLQGAAGNDTFNTGLGNDRVNAGDGMDTVILPMFPNVYSLSENLAGHVTGSYGTNVIYSLELNNVEFAQFGTSFQTTIALSTLVSGQAQVQLGRLTDLYLAFFGRAPDTSGLEYWQEQLLEKGRDFATISKDFAWSAEAQALYPIGGGNRSFVQTVYLNSFGRLPDPGGWDYWTGRLDGLGVTDLSDRGAFVGEVILGAYAPSSGAEDRALLTNRHEAAMYYVNRLWTTPAEGFDTAINTLLARVTGNPLTEDKAEAVIDHAFANPVNLTGIMTNAALLDSIWAAVTSSDAAYASDLGYGVDTADWVSITLQAGVSYQFDLIGSAADGASSLTLDDPLLALRSSAGTVISVDDDSGVELNSRLFYTPSVSGTYFLDVERTGTAHQALINSSAMRRPSSVRLHWAQPSLAASLFPATSTSSVSA
jgi:methionine-rich copper-binding protein CopC